MFPIWQDINFLVYCSSFSVVSFSSLSILNSVDLSLSLVSPASSESVFTNFIFVVNKPYFLCTFHIFLLLLKLDILNSIIWHLWKSYSPSGFVVVGCCGLLFVCLVTFLNWFCKVCILYHVCHWNLCCLNLVISWYFDSYFKYLEPVKEKKKKHSQYLQIGLCWWTRSLLSQTIFNSVLIFNFFLHRVWRLAGGERPPQVFETVASHPGHTCGLLSLPVYWGTFKSPYFPIYFLS